MSETHPKETFTQEEIERIRSVEDAIERAYEHGWVLSRLSL